MEYRITCIDKPHPTSPHEHITRVGNPPVWGVASAEEVIAHIEAKRHTFYVQDPVTGRRAEVGVMRPAGKRPYLRTYADGYWNDNLLALNQCPIR